MVIIEDKQMLKRCVKQAVRHVQAMEIGLNTMPVPSYSELRAMESVASQQSGQQRYTLRSNDEIALMTALDSVGLSGLTEPELQRNLEAYSNEAWQREILDAAGLSSIYAPITLQQAESGETIDPSFLPVLVVGKDTFKPGRYGISYEQIAHRIWEVLRACGIRYVYAQDIDLVAIKYCLIPVAEDSNVVLRLRFAEKSDAEAFLDEFDSFGYIHVILDCDARFERELISRVRGMERILILVNEMENVPIALKELGLHFIPYSSKADTLELLLGRWKTAREKLWPMLMEAYLPMARAGYTLTSDAIEQDVAYLLGRNLEEWLTRN